MLKWTIDNQNIYRYLYKYYRKGSNNFAYMHLCTTLSQKCTLLSPSCLDEAKQNKQAQTA